MTDLRKYETAAIQEMSRAMARELDDGAGSPEEIKAGLGQFKFRDGTNMMWTVAPRSGQWHRYVLNSWKPANPPAGPLEGPDVLIAWLSADRRRRLGVTPGRGEPPVKNAPELLQAMVRETRYAYDQGQISSAGAEDSLSGFYLLDYDGRFWMPGARSGDWYYFLGRGWSRAAQGPVIETLVDLRENAPRHGVSELSEALGAAFANFIEHGLGTLPEPVTDAWSPPDALPEGVRVCQVCGTADAGSRPTCRVCGTPYDGPIAVQAPLAQPSGPATVKPKPRVPKPAEPQLPPSTGSYAAPAAAVPPPTAAYSLPPGSVPPRPVPRPLAGPSRAAAQAAYALPAPPAPPAPRREGTSWLPIAAVGCALAIAVGACGAVAVYAAYVQGLFDMFAFQF